MTAREGGELVVVGDRHRHHRLGLEGASFFMGRVEGVAAAAAGWSLGGVFRRP